jgi:hypothetical protein
MNNVKRKQLMRLSPAMKNASRTTLVIDAILEMP